MGAPKGRDKIKPSNREGGESDCRAHLGAPHRWGHSPGLRSFLADPVLPCPAPLGLLFRRFARSSLVGLFCSYIFIAGGCGGSAPPGSVGGPEQAPPSKAELAAGKAIWETCTICHSTKEMQRGPLLEGREAWYVEAQLQKFKDQWRGTNTANRSEVLMASALDKLPDEAAIKNVAAYIATLPPVEHRKTVRGDVERGRVGYAACAICHGPKAEGIVQLKAPALDELEDWYIIDQLRKFKNKTRGYHPEDITGLQMSAAVQHLTPQDMKDITAFVARIRVEAEPPP